MYIAVKEKDNVYIGTSILENNVDSDDSDMVLEDNVPLFKVKGQKNTYVCVAETSLAADLSCCFVGL
ncbi:MAG: hypothetical protein KBS91_02295 [Firmicutes bacterium]|nr:hypothetical protein [Candidatus Caballimonas caccae]